METQDNYTCCQIKPTSTFQTSSCSQQCVSSPSLRCCSTNLSAPAVSLQPASQFENSTLRERNIALSLNTEGLKAGEHRVGEDWKFLFRTAKIKEEECQKLSSQVSSLEAQLASLQAELLLGRKSARSQSNPSVSETNKSISLDGDRFWGQWDTKDSQSDQREEVLVQFKQCRVQLDDTRAKLTQAALGWEMSDQKLRVSERRVLELEFELEASTIKSVEQDKLIVELQGLIGRLSEQLAVESGISGSLKSDLAIHKEVESQMRQNVFQEHVQSSITQNVQAEQITQLSDALVSHQEKMSSLEQELINLKSAYDQAHGRCAELENIVTELTARAQLLENLENSSKAEMARAVEELRVAGENQSHWKRECDRLQGQMQEALRVQADQIKSQIETYRTKLSDATAGWERSENNAAFFEKRCLELEAQMESMAREISEQKNSIIGLHLGMDRAQETQQFSSSHMAQSFSRFRFEQGAIEDATPASTRTLDHLLEVRPQISLNQCDAIATALSQAKAENRPSKASEIGNTVTFDREQVYLTSTRLNATQPAKEGVHQDYHVISTQVAQCQLEAERYKMQLQQAVAGWEACEQRAAETAAADQRRLKALEIDIALLTENATDQAALIEELQALNVQLSDEITSHRMHQASGGTFRTGQLDSSLTNVKTPSRIRLFSSTRPVAGYGETLSSTNLFASRAMLKSMDGNGLHSGVSAELPMRGSVPTSKGAHWQVAEAVSVKDPQSSSQRSNLSRREARMRVDEAQTQLNQAMHALMHGNAGNASSGMKQDSPDSADLTQDETNSKDLRMPVPPEVRRSSNRVRRQLKITAGVLQA